MIEVIGDLVDEFYFWRLGLQKIALNYHCKKNVVCRYIYHVEVGGIKSFFAATTAKVEIWREPLVFWGFFAGKRL
jgi:hypothetical protein